MNDAQKLELITRRERQLLVHSCLYYRMNTSIVSDHIFDIWSNEMVEFMKRAPLVFEQSPYYPYFKNFDGSSGYDLPYWLPEIERAAERLQTTPNKQEAFK